MSRRPRVLICSYWFPPSGGSGVQRVTKLAKYLPRHGWDVDVLTVKDVSYYAYDPGLLAQLPDGVRVIRSGSLDPARVHRVLTGARLRAGAPAKVDPGSASVSVYRRAIRALIVPDPQVLWLPLALRRAVRAVRRDPPDAVLSSSPPMSPHLLAAMLARHWRVPLVTDFRDPWTQDPYLVTPTRAHRAAQRAMERFVLSRSAHVVAISERIRDGLLGGESGLTLEHTSVIPNGYDPDDFADVEPAHSEGFSIRYVGALHPHHRTPLAAFLRAFAAARDADPAFASDARLRFVGDVHPSLHDLLTQPDVADAVETTGYLPHAGAVAQASGADLLLLLVDPAPGNETTVTGKVFDYIGARRPILLVGPHGDAADVLAQSGAGVTFTPDDPAPIADHLRAVRGTPSSRLEPTDSDRFNRDRHARQFAQVLRGVCGAPA